MSTKRIAVLGDFHGPTKLAAFAQFVREAQPDAVLQVGDNQQYTDMPVPYHFIHGNHEDWTIIEALRRGSYYARNLHYIRDAEPFTLFGLRVAGLGGIPRKDSKKESPKWFDQRAYDALSAMGDLDIMLTHDTPLRFGNRPHLTCEEYRTLAQVMRPRFWFSGHHHHFDVERLGPSTLISLGKWPHEAVLLLVDEATGEVEWQRWNPIDREYYDRMLPKWREAELASRKSINSAHTASEETLKRKGRK